MAFVWYICPYDTVQGPGAGQGSPGRRPAIARHIPSVPNPDGSMEVHAEILGNHLLCKVAGPDSLHEQIRADSDFHEIPAGEATIPAGRRAAIRTRLVSLGYTLGEIADTNWVVTALMALLTSATSDVREKSDKSGFEIVGTGRKPGGRTSGNLERDLPG